MNYEPDLHFNIWPVMGLPCLIPACLAAEWDPCTLGAWQRILFLLKTLTTHPLELGTWQQTPNHCLFHCQDIANTLWKMRIIIDIMILTHGSKFYIFKVVFKIHFKPLGVILCKTRPEVVIHLHGIEQKFRPHGFGHWFVDFWNQCHNPFPFLNPDIFNIRNPDQMQV